MSGLHCVPDHPNVRDGRGQVRSSAEARFSRAFRNSPGTGIDGLDEVTGGGLPKGRISVLLTAAPFGSDSN
jgi:hypothetical protein